MAEATTTAPKEIEKVPLDEFGIPYPIIPSESFLNDQMREGLSKHHEWFPSFSDALTELGGIAVRQSRLWKIQRRAHNLGSNALHPRLDPPDAPTDEKGQAKVCVFSRAGHTPEYGIDLWSGTPVSRAIEDGEKAILQAPSPLDSSGNPLNESGYMYFSFGPTSMMDFMSNYSLSHGLNLNDQTLEMAEEFVNDWHEEIQREVGHEILESVVKSATEDMEEDYERARASSLLHPDAPATAAETAIKILGNAETREKLFPWLARRLAPKVGRIATPPALQTEVSRLQLAYQS